MLKSPPDHVGKVNVTEQNNHSHKSSDVSVEVVPKSASVVSSTCTEPVLNWVGLGKNDDDKISNQYKSAGDSVELVEKWTKTQPDEDPSMVNEWFLHQKVHKSSDVSVEVVPKSASVVSSTCTKLVQNWVGLGKIDDDKISNQNKSAGDSVELVKKRKRNDAVAQRRKLKRMKERNLLQNMETDVKVDWSQSMDVARDQSIEAVVLPESIDDSGKSLFNAALPISMDQARLLTMDASTVQTRVEDEIINNQPTLLIDKTVPSQFRLLQKSKQRNCKDIKNVLIETKTANFDRSCLCSVLNFEQMKKLRERGMVFIHVETPIRKMEGNAEVVFWSMSDPSVQISGIDLSLSDVCVVTEFRNVKDDTTLAYVGAIKGRLPDDSDNIILTMIIQSMKKKLAKRLTLQNYSKHVRSPS